MAVNINRKKLNYIPRKREEIVSQSSPSEAPRRSQGELRAERYRERLLEGIGEEVIGILNEKIGLDLRSASTPLDVLAAVKGGQYTPPVSLSVTPLVYDSKSGKHVPRPKINVIASVRVSIPRPFKPEGVRVSTVPCRPLVAKDSQLELVEQTAGKKSRKDFLDSKEINALVGIGISKDRIYGGENGLSAESVRRIRSGERFPVEGHVRTELGNLWIAGEATLKKDSLGRVYSQFFPCEPPRREEGMVLDIASGQVCGATGNIRLELFDFDKDGNPVHSKAATDLIQFGIAMEPVSGTMTVPVRDEDGSVHLEEKRRQFQVSSMNGTVVAVPMTGRDVVKAIDVNASETETVHCVDARMSPEGKVYVNGESAPLNFVSARDRDDYLAGRGGLVEGASFYDNKTGKTETYKAWVVCDITGFGKKFSPAVSRRLAERRDGKKSRRNLRKMSGKCKNIIKR